MWLKGNAAIELRMPSQGRRRRQDSRAKGKAGNSQEKQMFGEQMLATPCVKSF